MDKWELLRQSIQEIHDKNQDKSDVERILRFLLNLMNVIETRGGNIAKSIQGVEFATIQWVWADERLPEESGEYLVTYHPCYWGEVLDKDRVEVGMDTFRGKSTWARNKYQRVIAWAEKPAPCWWEEEPL